MRRLRRQTEIRLQLNSNPRWCVEQRRISFFWFKASLAYKKVIEPSFGAKTQRSTTTTRCWTVPTLPATKAPGELRKDPRIWRQNPSAQLLLLLRTWHQLRQRKCVKTVSWTINVICFTFFLSLKVRTYTIRINLFFTVQ